jgi:DEAD/DEAH box helicase domain-containing protein
MHLSQVLDELARDDVFRERVAEWRILPPEPARTVDLPPDLPPSVVQRLKERGIERLYAHQGETYRWALAGRHVVTLTPTASGKSLGYLLPILSALHRDRQARALFVYPTKALAQDQLAALRQDVAAVDPQLTVGVYDGDTPPAQRQRLRRAGSLILTNPDMLHSAILPHHTQWVHLFENLRFVVLDELHTYRGVFGSHVAQVLRRLRRLCAFYGSRPQFLATSATMGNALSFATRLLGEEPVLVEESGAPRGERHVVLVRPRLLDRRTGLRESADGVADQLTARLVRAGVAVIVFCRSRQSVELHTRSLKAMLGDAQVEGYRGGYLPTQRRAVEKALRAGKLSCVVSTNALELGVDIGSLDAAVVVGYPGTVASFWQEAGRAGRRGELSATFLVATASPLDQYLADHPSYLFGRSPESPAINPENRYVLMDHLRCAAFELPFRDGETFHVPTTQEILEHLTQEGLLRHTGGRYYWVSDAYPAHDVSLRAGPGENFVVLERVSGGTRVLGEVDRPSAPTRIHEQAIYLHAGRTYQVEELDYENRKAFVRAVDVDYYTEAEMDSRLRVLRIEERRQAPQGESGWGDVEVTFRPTLYKKISFATREHVGWGPIHLPEEHLPTTGAWWTLRDGLPGDRSRTVAALAGLGTLLADVAALFLMCDPQDLGVTPQVRDPFTGQPTLYLYDMVPGGVGLAELAFWRAGELFAAALERLTACPCGDGCPSCIGPGRSSVAKEAAAQVLSMWQQAFSLTPVSGA